MKTIILLAVLMANVAQADWFCTTQSSERRGDKIYACGRGKTHEAAFKDALDEFKRVCNLTSSCKGHDIAASPKRTEVTSHGIVRLVTFEVLPTSQNTIEASLSDEQTQEDFAQTTKLLAELHDQLWQTPPRFEDTLPLN